MDKLLTLEEVTEITGLGRTTIWRYEQDGRFPARRKVGPNRVAWRASDVEEWIEGLPSASSES